MLLLSLTGSITKLFYWCHLYTVTKYNPCLEVCESKPCHQVSSLWFWRITMKQLQRFTNVIQILQWTVSISTIVEDFSWCNWRFWCFNSVYNIRRWLSKSADELHKCHMSWTPSCNVQGTENQNDSDYSMQIILMLHSIFGILNIITLQDHLTRDILHGQEKDLSRNIFRNSQPHAVPNPVLQQDVKKQSEQRKQEIMHLSRVWYQLGCSGHDLFTLNQLSIQLKRKNIKLIKANITLCGNSTLWSKFFQKSIFVYVTQKIFPGASGTA